jgi:hypothetical protein
MLYSRFGCVGVTPLVAAAAAGLLSELVDFGNKMERGLVCELMRLACLLGRLEAIAVDQPHHLFLDRLAGPAGLE